MATASRQSGARTALALGLLALAALASLVAIRMARGQRAAGPLRQEGYVWQRQWTDAALADPAGTAGAVGNRQLGGIAGIVALAAEADLTRRPPSITLMTLTPAPAFPAATATPATPAALAAPATPATAPVTSAASVVGGRARRLGLALRLGPLAGGGGFAAAPAVAERVIDLARTAVVRGRAAGWEITEIQLDYDCAETRLDDYARLVVRVRRAVAPLPVIVTALPSWLAHRTGFGALVAAADGFVLQVHSLARPTAGASVLCDPVAARAAVETAARWRRPFRVALPTYGYTVAFDARGAFVGLQAEGPALRWPPGTRLRTVRADPDALASLVRGWTRDRPRELAGILWYRLPAPGDRLNWRWPTLRAVAAGRPPLHALRPRQLPPRADEPAELSEIGLLNAGEADEPLPAGLRLRWRQNRLIAADGLAGYRLRRTGADEAILEPPADAEGAAARQPVFLPPGAALTVGWLRFAAPPGALRVECTTLSKRSPEEVVR